MKKVFAAIFLSAFCFLAAFVICGQVIPSDAWPAVLSSFTGGRESFRIITSEENTQLQLVWAYEAEVPQSGRQELENYRRGQDLSFKRFQTDESWTVSEEGYLQSGKTGAEISFPYPKFGNKVFVFCLRTTGGDAIVRHDYPGGRSFYRIEGKNTDALPVSSAMHSDRAWKLTQWICTGLLGGMLSAAAVFVFLKFAKKRPLTEAVPMSLPAGKSPFGVYAIAFLLPILLGILVCLWNGFAPFGNKTFLYNDMLNQNYKFVLYLKNMPKEGNDLFYSFSKVLGGNMLSLFSFYFNDPLYFLIYLFPESQIPLFCTVVILLHLGFAGLTGCVYLQKNGRSAGASVLFSCAYALMSFNIVCAENVHFLTCMVLLPMVMLGLEREIRQQRPLLYVGFLALCLVCNVYFGYMICLFSLIWFLRTEISDKRETFVSDLINFLTHSLLAAGLAMVVILPFALSLGNGPKTFSLDSLKPEIINSGTALLSKLITGAFNHEQMEYGAPSLFCGTVTAVFFVLYFFRRNCTMRERFATLGTAVVFLLSFMVSSFYLIWHGFNYPIWWPARFAFTFGFFVITAAADAFDSRNNVSWKELGALCLIFALIFFAVWRGKFAYISNRLLLMDAGIVLTCVLLISPFLRGRAGAGRAALLLFAVLLCGDLAVNMSGIWKTNFEETYPKTAITAEEYARQYEQVYVPVTEMKAGDRDFYRTEYALQMGENPGLLYSTNGLSHFSSTTGNDIRLFLDRMGFTARYRLSANYRYGSTMAADSFFGIRYLVSEPELDVKPYPELFRNDTVVIRQNPYALSLGFAASPWILAEELYENEIFENQEKVFSAARGEPLRLFEAVQDAALSTENLTAEADGNWTVWTKQDAENPGSLTWTLRVEREDMLYAYFPVLSQRTGYVSVNGRTIGKTIDPDNYGMIPLGRFTPGSEISVSLQFNAESISLLESYFVYEDEAAAAALFEDKLETFSTLEKISSSHLKGEITVDKADRWLLLTIPYSNEWRISVNGKTVPAEKVFNALMAVPLEQGKNQIEMRYVPSGFWAGAGISMISLVTVCVWGFLSGRKQAKERLL